MGERLGNQNTTFHTARKGHNLGVFFVEQTKLPKNVRHQGVVTRFSKEAARKTNRVENGLECFEAKLLGHQSDHRPRSTIVLEDVMAANGHCPRRWHRDAANRRDQRGFTRSIRPEERKDFALFNIERHALERFKP